MELQRKRHLIDLFSILIYYFFVDGSEKLSDNSPGAASISSVDIANEFAGLSSEEQERVRAEWSQVREKETPYLIIYAQN